MRGDGGWPEPGLRREGAGPSVGLGDWGPEKERGQPLEYLLEPGRLVTEHQNFSLGINKCWLYDLCLKEAKYQAWIVM